MMHFISRAQKTPTLLEIFVSDNGSANKSKVTLLSLSQATTECVEPFFGSRVDNQNEIGGNSFIAARKNWMRICP